jgi:hypothetical protein
MCVQITTHRPAKWPYLSNWMAGSTIRSEDLAGLRSLASRLDDRFVAGFVLYTGQQTLPYGDKLRAVPVDALWRSTP